MKQISLLLFLLFISFTTSGQKLPRDLILSCDVKEKGIDSDVYVYKKIQVTVNTIENGDGRYALSIMFDGSEMMSIMKLVEKIDNNSFEVRTIEKGKVKDKRTNAINSYTDTSNVNINRNTGFISYDFLSIWSNGTNGIVKGSGNCVKAEMNQRKF